MRWVTIQLPAQTYARPHQVQPASAPHAWICGYPQPARVNPPRAGL